LKTRNDLAFGLLKFVASILFAGMLVGVFLDPVATLFALEIEQPSSELAQTQQWFGAFWTFAPFFFLVIIAVRLLSRASFESRGGV